MPSTTATIHGTWLTPACFAPFCTRFNDRGYAVVTAPRPLEDRSVEELRRAPEPSAAALDPDFRPAPL